MLGGEELESYKMLYVKSYMLNVMPVVLLWQD